MIELKDVTFRYRGTERPALNRVNLHFAAGEFALICGATGSGKSTLLRIMNSLAPHFTGGELSGQIFVQGEEVTGWLPHDLATKVGFVNQQPESSFVTDTVREELAFGMEQLGFDRGEMIAAIARVSQLLGIESVLDSPLTCLSGGEQQRVAIAAALAAGAKILLMDEPTSALDPIAAQEVVQNLKKLSREASITVILVEHKIERVVELVDSIVIVGNDGLVTKGGREQFAQYRQLPPLIALANKLAWPDYPLSIPSAKRMWERNPGTATPRGPRRFSSEIALDVSNLSVRYENQLAVHPISFKVANGEIAALMGPNGSGKSSLLWAIQGIGARESGQAITQFGDPKALSPEERLCVVSMVPQKATDLLFASTVSEELAESDRFSNLESGSTGRIFESLTGRVDPAIHPRDLSLGQQLALVIAFQLVKGSGVLLLDEPTRGLDYSSKHSLVRQLEKISQDGTAVLVASHDVEFVAAIADRVLTLRRGKLVSDTEVALALGPDSELPSQIAEITGIQGVLTLDEVS